MVIENINAEVKKALHAIGPADRLEVAKYIGVPRDEINSVSKAFFMLKNQGEIEKVGEEWRVVRSRWSMDGPVGGVIVDTPRRGRGRPPKKQKKITPADIRAVLRVRIMPYIKEEAREEFYFSVARELNARMERR